MTVPWARGLRLFLLLVVAALQVRFFYTTQHTAFLWDQPLARFCLWYSLIGMLWNPFKTVLGAVMMAPLFSLYYISSSCENPGLAYLPLAAAGPAWVLEGLLRRRRLLLRTTGLGFLGDALSLALVLKMAVAAFSPSLLNSLWKLRSTPLDFPFSECQFMNVGFYLLNMLMLVRVVECEAGQRDPQPALLGALLGQFALVSTAGLVQAVWQWPNLTRNGLHSPFVGIHELAFYLAVHGVFFAALAVFAGNFRRRLGWGGLALLALVLLLGTNSKTSFCAVLLAGLALGILRAGRRSLLPVAGLGTLGCVGLWLLSSFELPIDPATARSIRTEFAKTLNPYHWAASGQSRLPLYRKALLLIRDRPLDGVGLGDYRVSHTCETMALQTEMEPEYLRDHDAHNLLLNLGCEAGLPTLALFLFWIGALCVTCSGQGGRPPGWGVATALAILTGLFTNLTNCVLTWPFQGLTFGLVLALPLTSGPEGEAARPSPVRWALLPALLGLLMAPWSVARDQQLQSASFGFRRWDWYPDERSDIAVFPEASIPITAQAGLARIVVKASPWIFERETLRVSVWINGQPATTDHPITREQGVSLPVPPGPVVLGIRASNPFGAMRWPATVGQYWIFRVELYDAHDQPIDVRPLPVFSEQMRRVCDTP